MTLHHLFRAAAWSALVVLVLVTVSPIGWRPHTIATVGFDRAGAFAVAGVIFALAYPRRFLSLALLLVVAAFFIEMLQWISPTRHARLADAMVKASGGVLGVALGHVLLYVRHRVSREAASAAPLHRPALRAPAQHAHRIAERDAPLPARHRVPAE
jgi:hypothetical protein